MDTDEPQIPANEEPQTPANEEPQIPANEESPSADEFPESFQPEVPGGEETSSKQPTESEGEASSFDEGEIEEEIQPQVANIEKVSLADIPIKLLFEVGRINVSLEELQQMAPGHKLPVDLNPRVIDMTVGGKSIGKGELVEVGDTIGVKIIELY